MYSMGRSTSLVSAKSSSASNTCGNHLRFKRRATYCARWNIQRRSTSPSATDCANSSENSSAKAEIFDIG
jgi:hypothetical protein